MVREFHWEIKLQFPSIPHNLIPIPISIPINLAQQFPFLWDSDGTMGIPVMTSDVF